MTADLPPGARERLGRRLGGCRLIEVVGQGGMSVVYRALNGDEPVAVQVLLPHFAPHGDRILREIRPALPISHPHLVTVQGAGLAPTGEPFFVLEYLGGSTLEDLLDEESPLPWRRAVHIADQIAAGLSGLHQRSFLHRDLKPENVMLAGDDRVKILDLLGSRVARIYAEREEIEASWGTLEYMSPEVARREDVDERADVYAVGAVLFDMVVGARPFFAETPGEILDLVRSREPPRPSEVRPELDLPEGLEDFILQVMAKDPDRRPASMDCLLRGLRRWR